MKYHFENVDPKSLILEDPAIRYQKSREGITKSDFLAVVAMTGLSLADFSSLLPVSKRTIEKVKDKELLSPQVSDRVLQIASLYHNGEYVLGSQEAFKQWISSPLIALGSKKPFDFLDSEVGISMISDILGRVAYGVYS
ncbi:MAG: DUF2384 domain-containing protein [Cyclobacteriaceae bacterium]|nr:DUF2384 domain-containing protein [Cyclobacteriaceae bacterium HetDA_MAG_MS6]